MIYLDNAATTLKKPAGVYRAVSGAMQSYTTPGRGGHAATMMAANAVFSCREAAAKLFNVSNPENIIFTMNATHALNIAIKSVVSPGDNVLISGYEHNAVVRPLIAMEDVNVIVAASALFEPEMALYAFEDKLKSPVSAVICTHVSNVFGYILPIERIAKLCRDREIPLIIDASQSAGCLPLDMQELGAAFICMPGHKGLYGPQGTGILIANHETKTIMEGGTGSESANYHMPDYLPDRLEAGTHNVPGIAGLLEGIKYVLRQKDGEILRHERRLIQMAAEGLSDIRGVRVYAAPHMFCQSGVLSVVIDGMETEIAAELLGAAGIYVRSGLHCAPVAHLTADTFNTGTIRFSVSAFNNEREIYDAVRQVTQLKHSHRKLSV